MQPSSPAHFVSVRNIVERESQSETANFSRVIHSVIWILNPDRDPDNSPEMSFSRDTLISCKSFMQIRSLLCK